MSDRLGGEYGSSMWKGSGRRLLGLSSLIVVAVVLSGCSEPVSAVPADRMSSSPGVSASARPSPSVGSIGSVLRSVQIALPNSSEGATADARAFYAAAQLGDSGNVWSIERVDAASGAVSRRRLTLPFLSRLTVGPDGLYVMTSVIDKYGRKPDTLLRLDPTTLATLARRSVDDGAVWDGSVRVAVAKSVLVEVDGGGTVRLLDPRTLATRASRQLLSTSALQGGADIESPTIEGERLWVLADHALIGLNLTTLAVTSRTPQSAKYGAIVATTNGPDLIGDGLARIRPTGTLQPLGGPTGHGRTQFAVGIGSDVLQQPDALPPALWLRGPNGALVRTTALDAKTGLLLAAAGATAWIEGLPGAAGDLTAVAIAR